MNELLTMLDTKYKRLEYIQSTGTQWIDTGVYQTNNSRIVMKASANAITGFQQFFGGGVLTKEHRVFVDNANLENNTFSIRGRYGDNKIIGIAGETEHFNTPYIIDFNKNNLYVNNELRGTVTETEFTDETTTTLFKTKSGAGVPLQGKICYCQIYDNGTLVRNFIPVLRKSDNEIGMLDLVEGKFYPNAGTGKFTANLDTMYAIIQGTPTVQDGVVSGFSSGNYLKTSLNYATNNMNDHNYEFLVNFTPFANMSSECYALKYYNGSTVRGLGIVENKLGWAVGYPNSSGHTTSIKSDFNITVGVNYWLKGIYQNKIASLYYSLDGKNYTLIGSIDETDQTFVITKGFNFGATENSSYGVFNGTIDLNRSYIKIDDTKYKLQAVVGYTVVGSPTITDGVVSGFSSANYLKLSTETKTYNEIEFCTKIKTTDKTKYQRFLYNQNNILYVISNGIFSLNYYTNAGSWLARNGGNVGNDTWLWIKIKFNIVNSTMICQLSNNGVDWTETLNVTLSNIYSNIQISNAGFFIGNTENSAYMSMDMNETYIKINNKLWFNGLPNN